MECLLLRIDTGNIESKKIRLLWQRVSCFVTHHDFLIRKWLPVIGPKFPHSINIPQCSNSRYEELLLALFVMQPDQSAYHFVMWPDQSAYYLVMQPDQSVSLLSLDYVTWSVTFLFCYATWSVSLLSCYVRRFGSKTKNCSYTSPLTKHGSFKRYITRLKIIRGENAHLRNLQHR